MIFGLLLRARSHFNVPELFEKNILKFSKIYKGVAATIYDF